ncbi:hypothetical protein E2562_010562 [Oryza meyeriana var. granulata]|uniref:Uncharacterized protein n=1 Tax=Oryza meyeriana var. granulata TaxID=110450 RepID=A0A6G1BTY2_9ORYZ|nr:hypothetical protein E2562_010562 [Oryza meyeriana var. granulata]
MSPSTIPIPRHPSDGPRSGHLILAILVAAASVLALAYLLSFPSTSSSSRVVSSMAPPMEDGCCKGLEGLELWGPVVNWSSDHRLPSAAACCASYKAMCNHGDYRCDSWVFYRDKT